MSCLRSLCVLLCAALAAACSEGIGPGSSVTWARLTVGSSHTCGLTSAGAAYCWDSNYYGELGDGSTTERATPVAVVNP